MELEHLTEQDIAGFLDHALSDTDRRRVEAHLEACARCRGELVEGFRLVDQLPAAPAEGAPAPAPVPDRVAAPSPARGGAATRAPSRTRRWVASGGAVAALAAAAALVLLLRAPQKAPNPAVRSSASSAESAVLTPLFPAAGAVVSARSLRFRWHAAAADAYRVTLLSESGEPVWTADVTDTTALLPATVHLPPGSGWFWRVDALTEGRSVSTGVQSFQVAP